MANVGTAAVGKILQGAGVGSSPSYSVATYPRTSGNVGNIIRSDGTNFISVVAPFDQTITGDSGGALSPTSGNFNILGDGLITTSGTGSTLTINSPSEISGVIRGPDVNFKATGNTSIYTFSAAFVVTGFVLVNTQLTGSINGDAVYNLGWTAATFNNIVTGLGAVAYPSGSTNEAGFFLPSSVNDFPIIPAGQTLTIRITTADTGPSVFVNRVDVTGYYFAGNPPNPPTLPITYTANNGGTATPSVGNVNLFARSGSTTIASSSTLTVLSPSYADKSASATSAINTGEFVTGAFTRTLPASAGVADGDLIEFVCTSASALIIQSVGTQKIRLGNVISGAAGSATSTAIGDSLSLRFRATDGFWYATSSIGNWTIV